jgi:hypothetical protein
MTSVEPLDGPDLQIGRRFRIRQPGLPVVVWQVSELRDGESFSWTAKGLGVLSVGFHRLSENPDGSTRITIGIAQSGLLAGVVGALLSAKTRRYLEMEAAGLKAASLAAAADVQS